MSALIEKLASLSADPINPLIEKLACVLGTPYEKQAGPEEVEPFLQDAWPALRDEVIPPVVRAFKAAPRVSVDAFKSTFGAGKSLLSNPFSRFAATTAVPAAVSAAANAVPPKLIPAGPVKPAPPGASGDGKHNWLIPALGLGVPLAALGASALMSKKKDPEDE
jgi:hypothetical protein